MNARLRLLLDLLRGHPQPNITGTELQAFNRNRVALLTAVANAFNKGIGMVTILAAISWTLPYLGETLTGAWLTLVSLVTVLIILDIGLGNALTNHISDALVAGPQALQREVSVGALLLLLMGGLVTVSLLLVVEFAPWQLLFSLPPKGHEEASRQLSQALWCYAWLSGLQVFTNGIIKAWIGLQKAHVAYACQTAFGVLFLGLMFVATQLQLDITYLLVCIMAPSILTGLLLAVDLLRTGQFNWQAGRTHLPAHWRKHASLGAYFFLLQIGAVLGWGADALIISSTLGVVAVAPFVICQRLFQFASQPVSILATPLWPAYANAKASGDRAYIRQLLGKSLASAMLLGGSMVVLIISFAPWLIQFLVDDQINVPQSLVVAYGLWVLLEMLWATFNAFLNGMGMMRLQAGLLMLYVAASLPLKFWAVQQAGAEGLLFAGILSYLVLVVAPFVYLMCFHKTFRVFLFSQS